VLAPHRHHLVEDRSDPRPHEVGWWQPTRSSRYARPRGIPRKTDEAYCANRFRRPATLGGSRRTWRVPSHRADGEFEMTTLLDSWGVLAIDLGEHSTPELRRLVSARARDFGGTSTEWQDER